jgi:DNA polymerase sigma
VFIAALRCPVTKQQVHSYTPAQLAAISAHLQDGYEHFVATPQQVEARCTLFQRLRALVTSANATTRIDLSMTGSTLCNVALRTSDVDVCLMLPGDNGDDVDFHRFVLSQLLDDLSTRGMLMQCYVTH